MLFKKSNVSVYKCKDFLLSTLDKKPFRIDIDTKSVFAVKLKVQDRDIEVRVTKEGSSVIVSMTDPYGLIRVPVEKFKDFEKFKLFVASKILSKL